MYLFYRYDIPNSNPVSCDGSVVGGFGGNSSMDSVKKLIIILCLLSTPVCADEWTRTDTQYQGVFVALTAVDWLQTKEIASNPKFSETNLILGGNPDQNKVDVYFASCLLAHSAISYYLPKKYRRYWQCVFIAVEVGYVGHNVNAGVRIEF